LAKPKKLVPEDCMPRCSTCAFAELEGEGGVCHRYPPKFVMDEGEVNTGFPMIVAEDWCGEYKRALQS
jgi:hypothetical protein